MSSLPDTPDTTQANAPTLSDADKAAFTSYLQNPILFPPEFKSYLSDWFATNVPKIHVSQIFGFKLQSIKSAGTTVGTYSVTGTGWKDAGIEPLTGLANGFYLGIFGGMITTAATAGLVVDGATTPDSDKLAVWEAPFAGFIGGGRLALYDLSQGDDNHTVKMLLFAPVSITQPFLHFLKVVTDA